MKNHLLLASFIFAISFGVTACGDMQDIEKQGAESTIADNYDETKTSNNEETDAFIYAGLGKCCFTYWHCDPREPGVPAWYSVCYNKRKCVDIQPGEALVCDRVRHDF